MSGTPHSRRTEIRSITNIFVELYSFLDNATFEITNTIDVSQHGARVLSKTGWAPNQRVSIRTLDGHMESRTRIVYCEQFTPGPPLECAFQVSHRKTYNQDSCRRMMSEVEAG